MGFVLLREAKEDKQHKAQNKRNEILRFAPEDIRAPVFRENLCLPVRFDLIYRKGTGGVEIRPCNYLWLMNVYTVLVFSSYNTYRLSFAYSVGGFCITRVHGYDFCKSGRCASGTCT